jgi:hypothetical protein
MLKQAYDNKRIHGEADLLDWDDNGVVMILSVGLVVIFEVESLRLQPLVAMAGRGASCNGRLTRGINIAEMPSSKYIGCGVVLPDRTARVSYADVIS